MRMAFPRTCSVSIDEMMSVFTNGSDISVFGQDTDEAIKGVVVEAHAIQNGRRGIVIDYGNNSDKFHPFETGIRFKPRASSIEQEGSARSS